MQILVGVGAIGFGVAAVGVGVGVLRGGAAPAGVAVIGVGVAFTGDEGFPADDPASRSPDRTEPGAS